MPKKKKENEVKSSNDEKVEKVKVEEDNTSNEREEKIEQAEKQHNEEDIKEFNEEVLSEFNGSSSGTGWKIFSMLLAVLLIASVLTSGFTSIPYLSSAGADEDEIKQNVLDLVNQNLQSYGVEATITSMELKDGLYEVELDVAGQSMPAYVSEDGKYLYPQRVDMNEEVGTATGSATAAPEDIVKADVPNLKMFVMTFCPYGQQAEDGLGPALELLGNSVEFEPHFVIYSDYASRMGAEWSDFCYDEEEKYCSMHGRGELDEGVRQLCVYMDNPEKWWDYVNAINSQCSYQNINSCWEGVADSVGLDTTKIQNCYDTKAETILEREVLLNKKFNVQGSPTVLLNDAPYNGGRSPENYKAGICASFNEAPESCQNELSSENSEAEGSC